MTGANPLAVTVAEGASAAADFEVSCAAVAGSLAITVTGLPQGADADVSVTGPSGFSADLTGSGTLDDLAPGEYTVRAGPVAAAGDTWNPSPASVDLPVTAGETATATIGYDAAPRPSLNLRFAGIQLTQAVQTFTNTVPLVSGRDGFLRVFVVANEANTAKPTVRVRVFDSGTFLQAFTIDAPGNSAPPRPTRGTSPRRGMWDIPGDLIRPGLELVADLDPDGVVPEHDETDNRLPDTGRRALTVRTQDPLRLMLVPVHQSATGLTGRVSGANRDEYLDLIRRIYPIPGYDAAVHATFNTEGPLRGRRRQRRLGRAAERDRRAPDRGEQRPLLLRRRPDQLHRGTDRAERHRGARGGRVSTARASARGWRRTSWGTCGAATMRPAPPRRGSIPVPVFRRPHRRLRV